MYDGEGLTGTLGEHHLSHDCWIRTATQHREAGPNLKFVLPEKLEVWGPSRRQGAFAHSCSSRDNNGSSASSALARLLDTYKAIRCA